MEVVFEATPTGRGLELQWDNPSDVFKYFTAYKGQKLSFAGKPVSKLTEKMRMYRYLHKAILPVFMEEFTKAGWELLDLVRTDGVLKNVIAREPVYNPKTQKTIYITIDKKDMNKDRLLKYITDALHLLETQYKRTVLSGDEWREKMRLLKEDQT